MFYYKIDAIGNINAKTLGELGLGKSLPNNRNYEYGILRNLRLSYCDYIYDKFWIDRILKMMSPSEMLIVKQIDDYYRVSLTKYTDQVDYYTKWCDTNNLVAKQIKNFTRFIQEVKIIWE